MKKISPIDTQFCRFLKAKNPFGALEGGQNDWYMLDDANTIFWCVKGNGACGPDNGPIDPHTCQPGRKCYREKK